MIAEFDIYSNFIYRFIELQIIKNIFIWVKKKLISQENKKI